MYLKVLNVQHVMQPSRYAKITLQGSLHLYSSIKHKHNVDFKQQNFKKTNAVFSYLQLIHS